MGPALADIVRTLRSDPLSLLTTECVLALGAFVFGYRASNPNARRVLEPLAERFEGPDQADPCTRVYLTSANTRDAMKKMLDALSELVVEDGLTGAPPLAAPPSFVEFVRESILQGRPALVLAEPSVVWLADFASGYISGVREIDEETAATQEAELRAFEAWLREDYGGHSAPWYGIIRVHEGACERGLRRFVELWENFVRSRSEPT